MAKPTLGTVLGEARAAHDLSLQEVADRARCSPAYVHKLEADKVRSPSPKVLAGLAAALGLAYVELMSAAGYDELPATDRVQSATPTALKRYSNAHIVELLEALQRDVEGLRVLLEQKQ